MRRQFEFISLCENRTDNTFKYDYRNALNDCFSYNEGVVHNTSGS